MVWAWIGGGLLLCLAALALVGWLLRRLWRQTRTLGREVGRLADEVSTAAARLDAEPRHTA